MTDYEVQALEVARGTLFVYQLGAGIAVGALLASIIGGVVAFFTLRTIVRQLENAKWNALLAFEQDMSLRRDRFHSIAREAEMETISPSIGARFDEAKESYLNAVERLASSILNGQFPEKEMKQSYREYIVSTIREFPDSFRPGTPLRKTLALNERWQD
jgi:hypothetical protein